jgi:hypothetical protein
MAPPELGSKWSSRLRQDVAWCVTKALLTSPARGELAPLGEPGARSHLVLIWNLLHPARMPRDAGGIPPHGNQRSERDAGCRFDFENPDYR